MKQVSRRGFLAVTTTAAAAAALGSQAARAGETPWVSRLKVADPAAVKVLQFTDVHFFNGIKKMPPLEKHRRKQTVEHLKKLLDLARPDLFVVTGDLWHDNDEGRGAEYMAFAVEQLSGMGVPWAFTWGNHDQMDDFAVGHKAFAEAKDSLYAGSASNGNYVVSLESAAGERLAELFCLNTKTEGMDGEARDFTKSAAKTLDAAGPRPLRIGAFHIPVRQYQDIWDDGSARGVIGEDVCFEKEDRSSLPVLAEAGLSAVICGHDHVNDYSAVSGGVDLIYGRATGVGGYGAEQVPKGAKLYTLDPARRAYEWVSLQLDGTKWQPAPDERRDIREKE